MAIAPGKQGYFHHLIERYFYLRSKYLLDTMIPMAPKVQGVLFVLSLKTAEASPGHMENSNKKSRIRETPTLSSDADSRIDTILEKLRDFSLSLFLIFLVVANYF